MTSKRKQKITRVLCFVIAFSIILGAGASLVSAATLEYVDKEGTSHKIDNFRDTKGHWAEKTLKKWAEYEIIVGDNGNFMPNKPITRADLAVVIDRLLGLEEISYHYFQDLPSKAYYRDSMLKASAAGYIKGTSENTLNPMGLATREEVAAILTRIYKLDTVQIAGTPPVFKDASQISSWAKTSVEKMAHEGYMNGYAGNVRPKDRITRAEVITLLAGIADAYIPRRDVHGTGTEYKNDLSNNIVLARNVSMTDSKLSKDIVITQSGRVTNLERVTVGRRILALGDSTINLNKVNVPLIEVYGRAMINGLDTNATDIKIMTAKASETRIDAIPRSITLAPNTVAILENERFENDTSQMKVITYKEIVELRADKDGRVEGGPEVTSSDIGQNLNNNIEVTNIKIKEGKAKIVEMGIVEADKGQRPTINKNTGKFTYKHTGEYLETEIFNFTADKVKAEKEYRVYVRDSKGLYGYGDIVRVGEYKFGTKFEVKVGDEAYSVDIIMGITGENMPEISNVAVIYSDKESVDGIKTQSLSEETLPSVTPEEKEYNKKNKKYKGTIKVTEEEMIRDYGYLITYSDGNTQKEYPVKKDFNPDNFERKYVISTGDLVEQGRDRVEVQRNTLRTENTDIREYGIIYKTQRPEDAIPTQVGEGRGWVTQGIGKTLTKGNEDSYTTGITITQQGLDLYYAAYARVDGKMVYGTLKKHNHNWGGDIDSPELEDIKVNHLGKFAVIEIKLKGDKLIDANSLDVITNMRGSDGVLVANVNNKSLNDLNANITQDLWGTKSITIIINEETLQGKGKVTGEIRLKGVDGKQTGKYSIALTPENEIKYKPVGRDGNKVTYEVATEGFKSKVEIKKVISGTNMSDTVITNDGQTIEVIKDSPGVASILTVEIAYYVARSIGNIKIETITTNITLP